MSTENPLAVMEDMPVAEVDNDEAFNAIKSSQAYLPRLQLMTANSELCKSGDFPINHYSRVMDSDNRDLGATVDILVIAWRPLALDTPVDGDIITCFDPKSIDGKPTGEFARIQEIADRPGMNGAMYGPQFLVWVGSEKEFMTFFMSSKTARRASPQVKALMHDTATLGSQKIEGKDFTWFGPTSQKCTTPFEMPLPEDTKKQMETFLNPPEPEVTTVDEEAEAAAAAAAGGEEERPQ